MRIFWIVAFVLCLVGIAQAQSTTFLPQYNVSSGVNQSVSVAKPLPVGVYTSATAGYCLTSNGSGPATFQACGTSGGGILPVANGGTGTSTAFTQGSIVFAGAAGVYSQDNASLFWDATNAFLGLGTAVPIVTLDASQNTDAIALPVGTAGTRPTAGNLTSGELRYNSTGNVAEVYNGSVWQTLLSGLVSLTTGVTGILPTANGGTNLATQTPSAPEFLTIGTTGIMSGSFQGTSQFIYNSWPGLYEITDGTSGSPEIGAKSTVKISRTDGTLSTSCGNNAVDNECNAALNVTSKSVSTATMQTSAIVGNAVTATAFDAVGVTGHGRSSDTGSGIGTGAYLEGRRDVTGGKTLGAEIRSENVTASNTSYNTSGIGTGDGVWITASGNGTNSTVMSAAAHCGVAGSTALWHSCFTANSNAVDSTGFGFDDESAGLIGYKEGGTHTYALVTASASGLVGFGITTPGWQLDVLGTTAQRFRTSGSNAEAMILDDQAGGQQAVVQFSDAGTQKWLTGKQTDNSYLIYDSLNTTNAMTIGTSGQMSLGESQQIVLPKTGGITLTGAAVLGSATGGAQATGTLNAVNLYINGVAALTGNQTITLSGDLTGSGTTAITGVLATVNSNVGSFGSSTSIPTLTVNAKGLVTAASTNAVIAPAGTLTGTTLAANVVTSSLTSVGTLTGLTSNGQITVTAGNNGPYTPRAYISGNVYGSGGFGTALTFTNTTALVNDTVYASSSYVSAPVTLTKVTFWTSSSNLSLAASAKACVYGQGSDGKPAALLGSTASGTAITNSATDAATTFTLDAPTAIPAGQFFIAILTTATTGIRVAIPSTANVFLNLNGATSIANFVAFNPTMGYSASQAYASGCPSPFGTATEVNTLGTLPVFAFTVQ